MNDCIVLQKLISCTKSNLDQRNYILYSTYALIYKIFPEINARLLQA